MKRFRVYISQVNQTYIDVSASNSDVAERKAEKQWYKENGPSVMSTAELLEDKCSSKL